MRILRAADHKRMPWKNGKGTTTEIAVFPADARLDDFAWRISMADVTENGPFSTFPSVDRTLSILEGEGMELQVAGLAPAYLTRNSAPFSFPADAQTSATLPSGPITDLNVMSRRGTFTHSVRNLRLEKSRTLDLVGHTTLLLCHHGQLHVRAEGHEAELSALDGVICHGRGTLVLDAGQQPASIFLVTLDPVA